MRSFTCICDNTIFFENTQCVSCKKELGWCPACQGMTALLPAEEGQYQCGNSVCGVLLAKCRNYAVEKVCNRCLQVSAEAKSPDGLCDYCRFNDTIPDLTVPGNREMWMRLEAAKRRLLYTLDHLRLPYGSREEDFKPPLTFDFKSDTEKKGRWWWAMGKEERVYTGHAGGKITINVREADPVEREKARVQFQEAHRTIIGHFRHEIGHYYWQMLIQGQREPEFQAAFGDHNNPPYAQAQQHYYQNGPRADWRSNFISAYATMHPWEDFAETFATYLDMVSVLDTALRMNVFESCDPLQTELPAMVKQYAKLGVVFNEMNRAMGLTDLVPEIFGPPVVAKLQYVHQLIRSAARPVEQAKEPIAQ
jgi:hypothetical protein